MHRRRLPAAQLAALALSFLAAFLAAFLAGCATDPAAEKAWQGATYDQVVAQWGPPQDGSTLSDGTDVRLWISELAAAQPSSTVGFGVFGGRGGIGTGVGVHIPVGPPPEPRRCERRLYFRGGYVVDEEWLGDSSACGAFRRR